ncbi:hypothetical protein LP417_11940 [Polaromonas sp. P1-6]|nr:hypothetical protein LP417_11940 [Polaromonas sp. P1-6]UUZ66732.1 hypothetical protein LP416_16460 [Polaromonas sp. P2-4]
MFWIARATSTSYPLGSRSAKEALFTCHGEGFDLFSALPKRLARVRLCDDSLLF